MLGELLSTPVWQLYHRGWKESGEEGEDGKEGKARKEVLRKPLYLLLVTLFCEEGELKWMEM